MKKPFHLKEYTRIKVEHAAAEGWQCFPVKCKMSINVLKIFKIMIYRHVFTQQKNILL